MWSNMANDERRKVNSREGKDAIRTLEFPTLRSAMPVAGSSKFSMVGKDEIPYKEGQINILR